MRILKRDAPTRKSWKERQSMAKIKKETFQGLIDMKT